MNLKRIEKYIRYHILPYCLKFFLQRNKIKASDLSSLRPKKILLVKVHHKIGDLLLATPLLTNLKSRYPDTRIDFLAGTYNFAAVLNNPNLFRIYIYNKKKIFKNLVTLFKLRRMRYDLGIVLSASSFSVTNSLLAHFAKTKVLYGFEAPVKGTLKLTDIIYNHSLALPKKRMNESLFCLGLLAPLSVKIRTRDELMGLSNKEKKYSRTWYEKNLPNRDIIKIGLHPGGTYEHRKWPFKNFQKLIELILKNKKSRIILFWGPGEEETVNNLMKGNEGRIFMIPFCNFRELASLEKGLDLFIGHDTGTLHSAASLGCSSIGLYITTDPVQWRPLNRNLYPLKNPSVKKVYSLAWKLLQ